MSVYIAASSSEMDRAEKWKKALEAEGVQVNSTWIDVIRNQPNGEANPRDATIEQKKAWCLKDVKEALGSSVLWLLMPQGPHSFGATFEYAFYVALSPDHNQHFVSGDYKRSIFTSFSTCFDKDEDAFEAIVKLFKDAEPKHILVCKSLESLPEKYQAECSCGWKSDPVVSKADAYKVGSDHTPDAKLFR